MARFLNWLKSGDSKGAEEIQRLFGNRTILDDQQFFETYYAGSGISREVAIGVRSVFIERLPFDMRQLAPEDNFKRELNFVWKHDSLADVELLCEIEKKFRVKITDAEGVKAATMGDVIELVQAKLPRTDP
jgi:acyl carrier protein